MPCILVGMDQKDIYAAPQRPRSSSTAAVACSCLVLLVGCICAVLPSFVLEVATLIVDSRSGMFNIAVFTPRAVFPSVVAKPRCSASWPVWVMLRDSRRHSFRAAEADPHGPDYSAVPCDSTVAVRFFVVDVPVVRVVQILRCRRGEDHDPNVPFLSAGPGCSASGRV